MISRRKFLERAGAATTGLLLSETVFARSSMPAPQSDAESMLDPSSLTAFVDPLPLPPLAKSQSTRPSPENPSLQVPYYRMAMQEMHVKVHRDLPPTRVWGFNNSSPGPVFETRSGEPLLVEWANALPTKHFLPIDHHLHGAEKDKPEVRSVIHLHGGKTPPQYDGYPEEWYVPGRSATYYYPNQQDAALLFYHDHSMGTNRLNIYAGLQGLFLIRDAEEDALNLPAGKYEIPLVICDRLLRMDGQLYYPTSGKPDAPWVPEVFGNAVLVNGKLLPYLEVEPRKYRLRILNASNGRFYRLSLGDNHPLHMIGSDQGLLSAPVELQHLQLAPAERADVIVDFSEQGGQHLVLASDSLRLMQFRVARTKVTDSSSLPKTLRNIKKIPEAQAVRTRRLTLDEHLNLADQSMDMLLNNTPWRMPITEKPTINTTEIWELLNLTQDSHPIHLHLVRFQILDRRPFDISEYLDSGSVKFLGDAIPPDAMEAGWKDTVRADTGMLTRIIVPFVGYTGRYVWHCHILEHEDNEMMRPYEVVAAKIAT
ncbi:MAG: multicopper oxidase family protein [Acidobacteriaceae bacterium]